VPGWEPQRPWVAPADLDHRQSSCVAAADAILELNGLHPRLLAGLLDQILWHLTVHPSKYDVRWRTRAAWKETRRPYSRYLRHEHVFERAWLRRQLTDRAAPPTQVLRLAVACLVTIEEDAALRTVPTGAVGWKRYRAAGLEIIDAADGTTIGLAELEARYPIPPGVG
jgi:hypothetical protein